MTEPAVFRLDRAWFDATVFPVTSVIPTRFGDMDMLGHINNVAVLSLLQEGRIAFAAALGALPADELRTVVAGVVVEYAGEMHFPAPAEVGTGVLRLGRSSMIFAQRIRQDGVSAVYAQTTVVFTGHGAPQPIPAARRAWLAPGLLDAAKSNA